MDQFAGIIERCQFAVELCSRPRASRIVSRTQRYHRNVSSVSGMIARALTRLSPLGALRSLTSTDAMTSELALADGWLGYCLTALLFTAFCAAGTLFALSPLRFDRPKPTGVMSHNRRRVADHAADELLDRSTIAQRRIPLWLNPVMVKEFRTRKFGRLHWLVRLVFLCAIISLMLTLVSATGTVSWGVARIAAALVLLQTSLLVVLGPSLAAGLIAGERETGGWQLLRMTPMSARRIVVGKLMSVV